MARRMNVDLLGDLSGDPLEQLDSRQKPVKPVKSGSRQQAGLKALGLATLSDLLFYLPAEYRDYTAPAEGLRAGYQAGRRGEKVFLRLTVVGEPKLYSKKGAPDRVSLRVTDGVLQGEISVFGVTFPWNSVTPGQSIGVYGKVDSYNGTAQLSSPEWVAEDLVGTVWPRYLGKPKVIRPERVAEYVAQALDERLHDAIAAMTDTLRAPEAQILQEAQLPYASLTDMLRAIHRPRTMDEARAATDAVRRLAAYQVYRASQTSLVAGQAAEVSRISISEAVVETAIQSAARLYGRPLTHDQATAIQEILADLAAARPMNRLLSGDVGTGKTLAFLIPAVAVAQSGAAVAIVSPSQLLSQQIYNDLATLLPDVAQSMGHLIEGGGAKSGRLPNPQPGAGEILIGTSAILHAVEKHRPGWKPDLLIIDEQQKFSREQRELLAGPQTNLLEATATAIPRTQALVTHGGMDISIIRECPVKKEIQTALCTSEDRAAMFADIKRTVAGGGQVAIIYPLIESQAEQESAGSAAEVQAQDQTQTQSLNDFVALWERHFPGQVCVLHGRMKNAEKTRLIREICAGQHPVIITSTVIEIGVTIPNLRTLTVVNPERFGINTLHQIRGRLARRGGRGKCYLYLPSERSGVDPDVLERLQGFATTLDGFELAEQDLDRRGFGDLSTDSELQHGFIETLFRGIKPKPSDLRDLLQRLAGPAAGSAPVPGPASDSSVSDSGPRQVASSAAKPAVPQFSCGTLSVL